jgi:osmotically-inducible protein OsmY
MPIPRIRRAAKAFAGLALAATVLAASACVVTTTPEGKSQTHWSGDYAREQATQKDADRQLALSVRKALADDPQLQQLHLRFFVSDGEVSVCGPFPSEDLRSRVLAVISAVDGVSGVDEDCRR